METQSAVEKNLVITADIRQLLAQVNLKVGFLAVLTVQSDSLTALKQ